MAARLAPVDNFYVKSRRELIQKEIVTQLKWYNRSGRELIDKHLTLLRGELASRKRAVELKSKDEKTPIPEESKPMLVEVFQSKKQLEDIARKLVDLNPEDEGRVPAADPEVRALLYKGKSFDSDGRRDYLRKRSKLSPLERYGHPPLSLWIHGWLQDAFPKERLPMSDVPLPHVLRRDFRRHGIPFQFAEEGWPQYNECNI